MITKKALQEIIIPEGIKLEYSEFYAYDPTTEFTEELNNLYLKEDLFQASFEEERLIVDMGWYGDLKTNDGEFKILVVYAADWDFPVTTLFAKSLDQVTDMLHKLLVHMASDDFA
ncbi:MAG: hypothetical protein ACI865_001510 [Flavobacteriaceae bacterium]|jgi:hypothetical protein